MEDAELCMASPELPRRQVGAGQANRVFCPPRPVTAEGYATLEPSILFEWDRVFRVPLDVRKEGES